MMHINEKFEILGNLGYWCIQDENSNHGLVLELEVDGLVSRNFHAPISVQYLSSLFLNALVDGASTTCYGNAFQQLITRIQSEDSSFWPPLPNFVAGTTEPCITP